MSRSLNVLSKILGLTTSTNPNEAAAAEAKLEQQLKARGISREQLEKQLDMQTVEENIEATSFRYGDPYKRIDPATQYIVSAVAHFYNGSIVFCVRDENGKRFERGTRQIDVMCSKARQIEIQIYTDYILQALDDKWAAHCKEDPFMVAMKGAKYRNDFRKGFAEDIHNRLHKMKREEQKNGRQLQIADKTVNQSALAVVESNKTEKAIIKQYKEEKYGKLPTKASLTGAGSEGRGSGLAAGSSVGLNRQVAGGGQKRLSGY
tara:strand:+ start:1363 stop:2148 length:786 start_codon:yes stop_codon:yes gene_type:complete